MVESLALGARHILRTRRGANMVEYIILVGMIALICVVMFGKFGEAVKTKVRDQGNVVQTGINGSAME